MSSRLTFDAYQERAAGFAIYPDDMKVVYPTFGLVGEFGEFCGVLNGLLKDIPSGTPKSEFLLDALAKIAALGAEAERIKKQIRDADGATDDDRNWALAVRRKLGTADVSHLLKEKGDRLWYDGNFLDDLGVSYGAVADANLKKLEGRKARGTIQGSGEER